MTKCAQILSLLLMVRETNGELYGDSRDIARGLGIQHESFIRTIDTHKGKLEKKLGLVRFEIVPIEARAGSVKFATRS